MQEAGIPVTYAYISDLHEKKPGTSACTTSTAKSGFALGPGDSCFVDNAKAYDAAFETFFERLAADGITPANTIFEIGAEENDHFAGANATRAIQPTPAGCDGVTVACSYAAGQIGELRGRTSLDSSRHSSATRPSSTSSRRVPRCTYTAGPVRPILPIAGSNVMSSTPPPTIHTAERRERMSSTGRRAAKNNKSITSKRRTRFGLRRSRCGRRATIFFSQGPQSCTSPCVTINPQFAWDHGYYSPDIDITWTAFVGPGVANKGVDGLEPDQAPALGDPSGSGTVPQFSKVGTWVDEADTRPTELSLVGLKDDYPTDGRVITELLSHVPAALRGTESLGACYKQLNGGVGVFATNTLIAETAVIGTGSATNDAPVRANAGCPRGARGGAGRTCNRDENDADARG